MSNTNEYVSKLKDFRLHLNRSVCTMLDEADKTNKYDKKYDIVISVNGKSVNVELHADAYARLEAFLDMEIEEAVELERARKDDNNGREETEESLG